jgi:hypothetical protein
MVQKKEMIAEFEKLTYNSEMLKNSWKNQLVLFKKLNKSKISDYEFTNFIDWILRTRYSEELFAGSSMWRLFISMPNQNGKLNYQQTLKIEFDNGTGLYEMEYSDWDTISAKDDYKKAIIWTRKSTGIELINNFLEFINWNKNWC